MYYWCILLQRQNAYCTDSTIVFISAPRFLLKTYMKCHFSIVNIAIKQHVSNCFPNHDQAVLEQAAQHCPGEAA